MLLQLHKGINKIYIQIECANMQINSKLVERGVKYLEIIINFDI